MSDPVRYEQDGGIVVLTLNEPATRNAISPAALPPSRCIRCA